MKKIRRFGQVTNAQPTINWGMTIVQIVIGTMVGFFLRDLLKRR